jgi:hypothetical protein
VTARGSHGRNRGKRTEVKDQRSTRGGHVSITCCPWLGRLHEPRLKGNALGEKDIHGNEVARYTYVWWSVCQASDGSVGFMMKISSTEKEMRAFTNGFSDVVALLRGRSTRAVDLCPSRCGGGDGAANDAEKLLVSND